jgi:hypothetical protein
MSRKELVTVMQWLDPALHPVLVQGPESAMKKLLPANLQLTQLR